LRTKRVLTPNKVVGTADRLVPVLASGLNIIKG
jgi:hypothetical protein